MHIMVTESKAPPHNRAIVGLTVVNDFRTFHSEFSTNCLDIFQVRFSRDVAITVKIF